MTDEEAMRSNKGQRSPSDLRQEQLISLIITWEGCEPEVHI